MTTRNRPRVARLCEADPAAPTSHRGMTAPPRLQDGVCGPSPPLLMQSFGGMAVGRLPVEMAVGRLLFASSALHELDTSK